LVAEGRIRQKRNARIARPHPKRLRDAKKKKPVRTGYFLPRMAV
jgi:hypothetical protein